MGADLTFGPWSSFSQQRVCLAGRIFSNISLSSVTFHTKVLLTTESVVCESQRKMCRIYNNGAQRDIREHKITLNDCRLVMTWQSKSTQLRWLPFWCSGVKRLQFCDRESIRALVRAFSCASVERGGGFMIVTIANHLSFNSSVYALRRLAQTGL